MSVHEGDAIPPIQLCELDDSGSPRAVTPAERLAGKRIVPFAVPAAFTHMCSEQHLPDYAQHAGASKARGLAALVCVAVNAPVVLTARGWERGDASAPSGPGSAQDGSPWPQ